MEIEERWEIDVEGRRRAWKREREDEGVTDRKRWLVVGVLTRRGGGDRREGESAV